MRPGHKARIRQALLRETVPYHYVDEKILQEWIPFPKGYTPAWRRPEGQAPEPRWEVKITLVQPSLDYVVPDSAFKAHQQLPQPLNPGEPSDRKDLPEPGQESESDTSEGGDTSDPSGRPETPSESFGSGSEDEQALEVSGFQNLPCCKNHKVHRPKPDLVENLSVPLPSQ